MSTTEEEKLLRLAIKNSLMEVAEKERIELEDIPEMKTFRPTEEEFTNPIEYAEKLYKQGAHKYGTVKIIPPASFKPPMAFDQFSEQKIPTRYQDLFKLSQGKVSDFR
jgi:hypothetical protein